MNNSTDDRNFFYKHPVVSILIIIFFVLPILGGIIGALFYQDNNSTKNSETTSTSNQASEKSQLEADISYNAGGISVTNTEDKPWGRCNYKLNNKYEYQGANVIAPADTEVLLSFSDFTDDNQRFDVQDVRPEYLKIQCYRDGTDYTDGDYFFK